MTHSSPAPGRLSLQQRSSFSSTNSMCKRHYSHIMAHGDITTIHPDPLFLHHDRPPLSAVLCPELLHTQARRVDGWSRVYPLCPPLPLLRMRRDPPSLPARAPKRLDGRDVEVVQDMLDDFSREDLDMYRQVFVGRLERRVRCWGVGTVQYRGKDAWGPREAFGRGRRWGKGRLGVSGMWISLVVWCGLDRPLERKRRVFGGSGRDQIGRGGSRGLLDRFGSSKRVRPIDVVYGRQLEDRMGSPSAGAGPRREGQQLRSSQSLTHHPI